MFINIYREYIVRFLTNLIYYRTLLVDWTRAKSGSFPSEACAEVLAAWIT
jgi:hypothetical protein